MGRGRYGRQKSSVDLTGSFFGGISSTGSDSAVSTPERGMVPGVYSDISIISPFLYSSAGIHAPVPIGEEI